jgi:CHASE2 domain-containing sensor protein
MKKLVVLNLGNGDLKQGFPTVTAQLYDNGNPTPIQAIGSLPAAPQLTEIYRRWQLLYQLIYEALYPSLNWRDRRELDDDIEIDEEDVTHISSVEFGHLCQCLYNEIQNWLRSESFRNIDRRLRIHLTPDDEIRVILQTEGSQTRQLPWHLWDFFEDYPKAVVGISASDVERVSSLKNTSDRIRILAVLGNSEGIEIEHDRAILEQLPDAEVVFLVEPQRRELDRLLWDRQGWDILFFAGHSSSFDLGRSGQIYINQTESLTIAQLKNSLREAIARGLHFAIFNSCDGLGLARQLEPLQIPQTIVMREPIPDVVAREFLKHFLLAFSGGKSFYLAVREAQDRLQGLEGEFPCASWLPVICQNPAEVALTWQELLHDRAKNAPPKIPIWIQIKTVLLVSLVVTASIVGMRSLGIFQFLELQAFDYLMRSRPPEKPDPRLLIVTITEADVQSQPAQERGGASLSDRTLAQLIEKLEPLQPRVIGLDIYRENPVPANYKHLATEMRNSDRFVAVCKASEDDNPGVPPPPEVSPQRLGFSDVVRDPDGVIRRHLLAMAPASPCMTDKSFSLRLATLYLASEGVPLTLTPEKNLQLGTVVLPNLEPNSGGYHSIDALGHQVMLNWRSSHTVAPTVTLADVLHHQLTPDLVRDRIVLIGTTAESFHDDWQTPYSSGQWPHQSMPGVAIQAHMVSQLLSAAIDRRPLLWVLPKWGEALWIECWALIGGILAWRVRLCKRLPIGVSPLGLALACAATIACLYGLCLVLLTQGGWVPLIPSAASAIGGSAIVFKIKN